eukprot:1244557-Pyramimonas_sp.AAC.1
MTPTATPLCTGTWPSATGSSLTGVSGEARSNELAACGDVFRPRACIPYRQTAVDWAKDLGGA